MSELVDITRLVRQRRIASGFSRAASSYDAAARLQREVADTLLARLPADCHPAAVLDIGCGTGYVTAALARRYASTTLGLDLASGMLATARASHPELAIRWLAGAAERLPLAAGSVDLVASSLALQWCDSLAAALDEAWRVLRPGGYLAFTTLCDGSLREWQGAWRAVDDGAHVNRFLPEETLAATLARPGWRWCRHEVATRRCWYPDLAAARQALKAIGANTVVAAATSSSVHTRSSAHTPRGLTGRERLARLEAAFEEYRRPAGIPISYRVATVVMQR
ncbi:malonyl-ACP O-methyltransferase BioC [Salinicola sp. DM10]|uniref:malonyl-ACP O-methyltransferase BioC n=1 Tax=Salinicola sp. DM10 TaxID=2815721 RepID=UPI001A8ECF74|nr:malonyl-ACP O-methyltransferase BioC [Salinicola sp. DM10]MCE3026024.1 malonyl-ACP O-methyltransferase BioC [Salinicola sp. DM10]